jgi:hypothetical protein
MITRTVDTDRIIATSTDNPGDHEPLARWLTAPNGR